MEGCAFGESVHQVIKYNTWCKIQFGIFFWDFLDVAHVLWEIRVHSPFSPGLHILANLLGPTTRVFLLFLFFVGALQQPPKTGILITLYV